MGSWARGSVSGPGSLGGVLRWRRAGEEEAESGEGGEVMQGQREGQGAGEDPRRLKMSPRGKG